MDRMQENTLSISPLPAVMGCMVYTVVVTALDYHQSVCLDMNRVVCCKSLILFFSKRYTQLRSVLHRSVNVCKCVRDMAIISNTYTAKNTINRMTLNHLVKGSNPLRPIDSTTIEDFTLDRSLDRQENHLEVNQSQTQSSQAEQNKELCPKLEQLTKNQLCGGSGVVNTLGRGPRDRRFDSDPSPQI